jgi:predicted N-acyltransferase
MALAELRVSGQTAAILGGTMAVMGYTLQQYDSIRDVPQNAWASLQRSNDVFMDPQFISAVEESMPGRFWSFLVWDDCGRPAGSANVCLYPIDAALLCPPRPRRFLRLIRRVWPGCLRLSVLFCGLPFSAGQSHLRIAAHANAAKVLEQIDQGLMRLARQVPNAAIVWKEFTDADIPQTDHLCRLGYVRGPSLPMNYFRGEFRDFNEFCAALRSHYRYKIHRSQRKFAQAGFRVRHFCGAEVLPHYTDEVHRLYLAVTERAEVKLEILPAELFRQWAVRCGAAVRLTAVFQDQRIVAFAWGAHAGESYQNVFIGLDYALNHEYDLYFNLMACDLDAAMRSQAREIQVGQTADEFKSRLGCYSRPRHVYVKGTQWFSAQPVRFTQTLLMPEPPVPPARDLFRQSV